MNTPPPSYCPPPSYEASKSLSQDLFKSIFSDKSYHNGVTGLIFAYKHNHMSMEWAKYVEKDLLLLMRNKFISPDTNNCERAWNKLPELFNKPNKFDLPQTKIKNISQLHKIFQRYFKLCKKNYISNFAERYVRVNNIWNHIKHQEIYWLSANKDYMKMIYEKEAKLCYFAKYFILCFCDKNTKLNVYNVAFTDLPMLISQMTTNTKQFKSEVMKTIMLK